VTLLFCRECYLRFDISTLRSHLAHVSSALMVLQTESTIPFVFRIDNIEDNTWEENSITWNNRPLNIVLSSKTVSVSKNSSIVVDLLEEVNQALKISYNSVTETVNTQSFGTTNLSATNTSTTPSSTKTGIEYDSLEGIALLCISGIAALLIIVVVSSFIYHKTKQFSTTRKHDNEKSFTTTWPQERTSPQERRAKDDMDLAVFNSPSIFQDSDPTPFSKDPYCTQCNKSWKAGVKFCGDCGVPLFYSYS